MVTVAALQTALTDDVGTNVKRVTELVREAHCKGARIILPSELFEGHYFCQTQMEDDFARAQPAEGHPTIRYFQELAKQLGVVIPVSFFEAAGPEHYNSIAVIDAVHHHGQIAYIQTLLGDKESHFFEMGN